MSVPFLLPCLLADPAPAPGTTVLTNATLFDGDPLEDVGVLLAEDRVHLVLQAGEPVAGAVMDRGL